MTDEDHPICPNCGEPVDPNDPGVVYAVPTTSGDEVGGSSTRAAPRAPWITCRSRYLVPTSRRPKPPTYE